MQHLPGNIQMWSRIVRVHCVRSLYSSGPASCRLTKCWERRYSPTNCNWADREFEDDRLTVEYVNCADTEFETDRLTVWATKISCCTVGSRGTGVIAVSRRLTLISLLWPIQPNQLLRATSFLVCSLPHIASPTFLCLSVFALRGCISSYALDTALLVVRKHPSTF